jgi:hypothetical protein
LLAALVSSGIGAQAATAPSPDSTYNTLLATYQSSSQDVCFANGAAVPLTGGACLITQTPTGQRNIAVCVQSSNAAGPVQTCSISQTNTTYNNYALVIQRIRQSTCAPPPTPPLTAPCQSGTQAASIQQTTTSIFSGSNFGGAFQTAIQSIGQQDDPSQTNSQHVEVIAPSTGPGGLEQFSAGGSNYGAATQYSAQSASGGSVQSQFADQVAGHSGVTTTGIDQNAPRGSNAAFLAHVQKQQLDSSPSQDQTALQDGDITQNGVPGTNLAFGTQFQNQQEQGPVGAVQHQTGDPKCCSPQNGGQFYDTIATFQFANHILPFNQFEYIQGNCDSAPSSPGNGCHMSLSATQQNNPPTTFQCDGASCHSTIIKGGERIT